MSAELNKILKNIKPTVMKNDIIVMDDETEIYAKFPLAYEDLPELHDINGFTRLDEKDIEKFFMDILNNDVRITSFEGIDSDPWFPGCSCDYCHTFSESGSFRRCIVCNLDMCNKCFGETSEEITVKKDMVEECRKHELLTIVFPSRNVQCDVCEKVFLSEDRYSNIEDKVDMCLECLDTEKGKELREKHKLKLCKRDKTIQEQIGYGSVFNWVPLYKDEENNMLLYNAVTGSDNYGKFSFMSCDDHGRCGFSIIRYTNDINDLGEELSNVYHQWREKKDGGELG